MNMTAVTGLFQPQDDAMILAMASHGDEALRLSTAAKADTTASELRESLACAEEGMAQRDAALQAQEAESQKKDAEIVRLQQALAAMSGSATSAAAV